MSDTALLTPREAARRLGVAERTLRQWRTDGTGPPHVRLGGRSYRYRPADIDAWIDAQLDRQPHRERSTVADAERELHDRIHAALSEDLAAEGGGMVTRFYLIAGVIDADGEQCWVYSTPPEQTQTDTLGLIEYARGIAKYEQRRYLEDLEGDDA